MCMISTCTKILIAAALFILPLPSLANELTILVPNMSGGYGIHARIVAKYLPKYIDQKVIVKEMPGAAGITLANYLYNVAAKDGTVIGILNSNIPLQGMLGGKTIQYKIENFTWLSAAQDGRLEPFMLWRKLDQSEMIGGSDSTLPFSYFRIINKLLNWNAKEIVGYANASAVKLAFERNEVNVVSNSLTGIKSVASHWLADKNIKPIVQWGNGTTRHPEYLDVPTLAELVVDSKDKKLVELLELQNVLLRAYAAPPSIPANKAMELQTAIWSVFTDAEYINEVAKIGISNPINYKETENIIDMIVKNFTEEMKKEFQ